MLILCGSSLALSSTRSSRSKTECIARSWEWDSWVRLSATECQSAHPFKAGPCRTRSWLCLRSYRHASCRTIVGIHLPAYTWKNSCSSNCTVSEKSTASSQPRGTLAAESSHISRPTWLMSFHLAAVQFHCSNSPWQRKAPSQCPQTLYRKYLLQCRSCPPGSASRSIWKRLLDFSKTSPSRVATDRCRQSSLTPIESGPQPAAYRWLPYPSFPPQV